MTVEKYYFTYGFIVKKAAYLEHFGYTLNNLPEDYVYDTVEGKEEALYEWIEDEHHGGKQVVVDGVNYIAQFFTHDDELYPDYMVIGIDQGSMEKFSGTFTPGTNCNPKDRIRTLTRNEDWVKIIQDSVHYSYTAARDGDHGVPDPEYADLRRVPGVHITTDDCTCCS